MLAALVLCLELISVSYSESPHSRLSLHSSAQEIAGWTYLRFKGAPLDSYTPENCLFTGISVTPDRIFLSVPRFRDGIPATLGWIPHPHETLSDEPITPYPSWAWQNGHLNNCSGFVSVMRTRVDKCGRIWALDTGVAPGVHCPPRLFVIDPKTDHVIKAIYFPDEVLRPTSWLVYLLLDERETQNCDDMIIYIADTLAFGIIMVDVRNAEFWRHEHRTFNFDPKYEKVELKGEHSTTKDGIIALAITEVKGRGRLLFYHSQSSLVMYAVPVKALESPSSDPLPVLRALVKSSQGVALATDRRGTIYFNPITETSVLAFNSSSNSLWQVARDPNTVLYLSDLILEKGHLWAVANHYPSYANRTYDPKRTNLRVLRMTP